MVPEPMDIQPKLEIVILGANHPNSTDTTVKQLEDEDAKQRAESDDDDQFIQTVEDFIKTIKPTKPTKLKKIHVPKPSGKLLSAKSAKLIAADTERLNFRSTSCPHSSQKLKKDNKWWRLMHDCNYCDAKDFLTVESMNKHLKLQHAELVKVTCDICKKDYSEVSGTFLSLLYGRTENFIFSSNICASIWSTSTRPDRMSARYAKRNSTTTTISRVTCKFTTTKRLSSAICVANSLLLLHFTPISRLAYMVHKKKHRTTKIHKALRASDTIAISACQRNVSTYVPS